jgi:membrane-associated phospholipid phosphatase
LNAVPVFEANLFDGVLPSIWLQRRLFDPVHISWFDQLWTIVYFSFFVVPHVVAIVLLFRNRDQFQRFVTASALLFLIGAISFALLPTNPPWLASPKDAGGVTLRIVNLVLADAGLRAEIPADGGAIANHHGFDPNSLATFPSIHLGVTVLLVPLASGVLWRVLAIAYTLAMAFSLVYLGEHYLLDVTAGALAAGIASTAARCLISRMHSFQPACYSRNEHLTGELV